MKKILLVILVLVIVFSAYKYGRSVWYPVALKVKGTQTVSEVIEEVGDEAKQSLLRQGLITRHQN